MSFKSSVKSQIRKLFRPAVRVLKPSTRLPNRPLSTKWGFDRGIPVARSYVDRFMEQHRSDIRGAILEVKDRRYTETFGQEVEKCDVLDIDPQNPKATVIADLSTAVEIPASSYDCFILNDTLQYIYNLKDAIAHAHRILKPNGVLLVTVPCTSQIDLELRDVEYWRFTEASCRRLFEEEFGANQIEVACFGNYVSCIAGLSGMAIEELEGELLLKPDPMYLQEIGVRALKKP